MAKYPLIHCTRDDEHACQVCVEKNSTTCYQAIEGTTSCPMHGGNTQLENIRKQAANQYRLQVWQQRVSEFTESEHIKSLRGEIGILKMVLEQILNSCQNSQQLLVYSPKISDLVVKIEKVVMSCDRLERSMGMTMDKSTAMKLAADIVELISTQVKDPNVVDEISNGIIDILKEL